MEEARARHLPAALAAPRGARCALCGGDALVPLFEKNGYAYARCAGCGTVRADLPTAPASFYADLYETGVLAREEAKASAPAKRAKYARAVRALGRPGRLLDVGCSVGGFLAVARDGGWTTAGVETSAIPARAALARGLAVAVADAGALPFRAESFDAVRMNAVLEHLLDPLAALREAFRVLRPGGRLALLTLSADSWSLRLLGPRWRYAGVDGHVHFFSRKALADAASRAGFTVGSIRTAGVRLSAKSGRGARLLETLADPMARGFGAGHRIEVDARRPRS